MSEIEYIGISAPAVILAAGVRHVGVQNFKDGLPHQWHRSLVRNDMRSTIVPGNTDRFSFHPLFAKLLSGFRCFRVHISEIPVYFPDDSW